MQPPADLPRRIRRARNDADLTQKALAAKLGVDLRTVQGWESADKPRHPRAKLGDLERVLQVDLTTPTETQSPRLDEASDSQLVAHFAGRLADRDRQIRDLLVRIGELETGTTTDTAQQRWAARTRIPDTD